MQGNSFFNGLLVGDSAMFIDYVTLMLLNMVAGLVLLAGYAWDGVCRDDQRAWAPGWAAAGLVALITGGHMVFHWPIPGSYNSIFGELTVVFGVLLLAGAGAVAKGWSLGAVATYGAIAGAVAMILGVRILHLAATGEMQFSRNPVMTGIGFILTGAGGLLFPWMLAKRNDRRIRGVTAGVLTAAAAIWAITAVAAYWNHVVSFAAWSW